MKVLIIEDEFNLADAIKESLEKNGTFADICTDGVSGLDAASTNVCDVILLDIMLPEMDGYELLNKFREQNKITPVIMITAKSELDDKLKGFSIGADDYLTKPFEMKELFARIGAVTKRIGFEEETKLKYSNLCLDIKKFEISSNSTDRIVNLSQKEFQLLEYLINNKNQVISRNQITERVWGYESEAEYNNVDVYISFIRKKIAFVGAKVKIKAVRGLGYVLEESDD